MLQAEAEKASVGSHIFLVKHTLCSIHAAIVTEEQNYPTKFVQAEGKEASVFVFRPGNARSNNIMWMKLRNREKRLQEKPKKSKVCVMISDDNYITITKSGGF